MARKFFINRVTKVTDHHTMETTSCQAGADLATSAPILSNMQAGYKYIDRLSDYLEDIGTMYVREFELDPLADFYYLALIPPLSVLAIRADICEKFIISVKSAVMGEMSLFTLEKNKQSLLQNLIQMNYSIDNLTTLIEITWKQEEIKTWRNDVLMKLLHHSNLAPSKYRPGALYDAFTKTSVLGPKHILALARAFC
ncbi:2566_t:CDS:2 [Gigaspora margarita]|uniref:2566_t:CDS:1 n=1 Tax=Gigaspora margarita TaxID=4874 RepID=A0ABN7UIQ2_GIGMA|nr:2566_t:CDS:2 [Gigaspora margarita]